MERRSQPVRGPSQPDDIRNYDAGGIVAQAAAWFVNGFPFAAKFLTGLTVQDNNFFVQDDADPTKKFQFSASAVSTGTTRIYGVPNSNTVIVGTDATQTIDNKTLTNTNAITVKDGSFVIQDDADATKQALFQASGITTGTTRTYTLPNATDTLMALALAQSPTNKTFDGTNVGTQAALTTLTAGTNMATGVTGFSTQGTRVVVPTGGLIFGVINLTCNNAGGVAVGGVIATVGSGHRPPGTIAISANKLAGGLYTPIGLVMNSAGQIVLETAALANTDAVVGTATWMTS